MLIDHLPPKYAILLAKSEMPLWRAPMLATLTVRRFSSPDWIYECKFDGIRALIFKKGKEVKIMSRNRIDISHNYPDLLQALADINTEKLIIDGEIIALKNGLSNFSTLQKRMYISTAEELWKKIPIYFCVFDILYKDNYLLERLPLLVRKEILRESFEFKDPIRYTEHIVEKGEDFFREACIKGGGG